MSSAVPFFSVVIPLYNKEVSVLKTIKSVLSQDVEYAKRSARICTDFCMGNKRHICSNAKRTELGGKLNWLGLRMVVFKNCSVIICFHIGLIFMIFPSCSLFDRIFVCLPT